MTSPLTPESVAAFAARAISRRVAELGQALVAGPPPGPSAVDLLSEAYRASSAVEQTAARCRDSADFFELMQAYRSACAAIAAALAAIASRAPVAALGGLH